MMTLEHAFYILAIIYMSVMLIITFVGIVAVLVIKAKINAIHRIIEEKVNAVASVISLGEAMAEKFTHKK